MLPDVLHAINTRGRALSFGTCLAWSRDRMCLTSLVISSPEEAGVLAGAAARIADGAAVNGEDEITESIAPSVASISVKSDNELAGASSFRGPLMRDE